MNCKEISEIRGMEAILDCLRAKRGPRVFKRWFSGLKICEKTATAIIFTAPTSILAEEISILFGNSDLLDAVRHVWPEVCCIRIKPAKIISSRKPKRPEQTVLELVA